MRSHVVEELKEDWPRYSPFIEAHLLPNYLSNMARSSEYVGEAELVALSKLHKVTIHVWGADETHDRVIRAPSVGTDAPTVHVAHRDTGTFRDHYWGVSFLRHEVRSPSVPPMLASVRRTQSWPAENLNGRYSHRGIGAVRARATHADRDDGDERKCRSLHLRL